MYRQTNEDDVYVFTKGVPDSILELCSTHFKDINQGTDSLNEEKIKHLEELTDRMQSNNLKIISFSVKKVPYEEFVEDKRKICDEHKKQLS